MIQSQKGYDPIAQKYAEQFFDELQPKLFDRQFLERLVIKVQDKRPVYDLGCGPGQIARNLHEQGVNT